MSKPSELEMAQQLRALLEPKPLAPRLFPPDLAQMQERRRALLAEIEIVPVDERIRVNSMTRWG